jgi:hypothetical protein
MDPIGNDELLSTLIADRDQFVTEDPSIALPDAIVVSGDLIQGVPLGTLDYERQIASQYETAAEFLRRLVDAFADGDRSRLVMVPGNHDVDWNAAYAAMTPVPDNDVPAYFSPALCGPTGDWRWNWKERRAYRITNPAEYARRLQPFEQMMFAFYENGDVVHADTFRLHSLCAGRLAIVAFDSCVGNDCFAFHGAILEDAIAQAHLHLHNEGGYELLVAVWHHNIQGDPETSDYMSLSTVHRLIGKGFRLGLHGHQHRAAAAFQYVHLPEEKRMVVVSAGSLCAGHAGLPTGVHRQYNIIELADNLAGARVHIREIAIATNFAPARRAEFGGKSYVELEWEPPEALEARARERRYRSVLAAEAAVQDERYADALTILTGDVVQLPYARQLRLDALRESGKWAELVSAIQQPASADELIAAAIARAELGDIEGALEFLDQHRGRIGLPDPTAHDVREAISAKRAMS